MNILLFVMTMLFLFATLTYARIEGYKTFSGLRSQFVQFMQVTERDAAKTQENEWYEKYKISTASSGGSQSSSAGNASPATVKTSSTGTGYAKLNIGPLIKPQKNKDGTPQKLATPTDSSDDSEQATQTYMILKKLIYYLYANKPFFQEMERSRPGFVDELIQKMREIGSEHRVRYAKDLANFNFNDEQLNYVTYKMFKGVPVPANFYLPPGPPEEIPILENDTESTLTNDANEYHSGPGYASILDFLMLQKKNTKIKVFLAGRPLLMAIFDDPNTVNEIISMRRNIRKELRAGRDATQSAEAFKNTFIGRRNPAISENMLDFNVSTTQPKDKWD